MKEEEVFELTSEGFLELETELNELKNVKRPEVINALKEARAMGDLSENADYDAARNDQAQIEGRIKELEYKLEHAKIVEKKKSGSGIDMGSIVTVKDEDGDEEEYTFVSSLESDPFDNKISLDSPFGKALKGHKVGDKVTVESPNGEYEVTIVKVA